MPRIPRTSQSTSFHYLCLLCLLFTTIVLSNCNIYAFNPLFCALPFDTDVYTAHCTIESFPLTPCPAHSHSSHCYATDTSPVAIALACPFLIAIIVTTTSNCIVVAYCFVVVALTCHLLPPVIVSFLVLYSPKAFNFNFKPLHFVSHITLGAHLCHLFN